MNFIFFTLNQCLLSFVFECKYSFTHTRQLEYAPPFEAQIHLYFGCFGQNCGISPLFLSVYWTNLTKFKKSPKRRNKCLIFIGGFGILKTGLTSNKYAVGLCPQQQYGLKGVKALCGLRYRGRLPKGVSFIQRERLPCGVFDTNYRRWQQQ